MFNYKCDIINKILKKDKIINNIRNELLYNINEYLSLIDVWENEKNIINDNIIYWIIPINYKNSNSPKNSNLSIIDFEGCEKILRKQYNISEKEVLYMFRLDIKFDNLLIPILEYEVYSSIKKLRLDLNYCSNEEIVILNPVKIKEDTLYKYLSNSNYYNDKCFNYTTDDETDIILNDRRK